MVGGALAAPRWLLILRSFIIRVAEPPTRPACRQSLCRVHLGAVTTRRCRSVYFHYIHKCFFVKKSREENYKLSMNRTRAVLSVDFYRLSAGFLSFPALDSSTQIKSSLSVLEQIRDVRAWSFVVQIQKMQNCLKCFPSRFIKL